jgi:hypothetical protein
VFDAVRDAVTGHGAGIRRLQPRRTTLEDVFLGEVGDSTAGAGAATAATEVAS